MTFSILLRSRLVLISLVLLATIGLIFTFSSSTHVLKGSLTDDRVLTLADTDHNGTLSVREMRKAVSNMIRAMAVHDLAYDLDSSGTTDRSDLRLLIQSIRSFLSAVCGNGTVESSEQCDDGNAASGDGCSPQCAVEPRFLCSGGSPSVCTIAPVCGNNKVESGEQCDGTLGCDGGCHRIVGCGSNTLENTEECDDGNTNNGDGCSNLCVVENAPPPLSLPWTAEPSIPSTTRDFTFAVALGKMWAIGGYDPAGAGIMNKVYATSDGKEWSQVGTLPYSVYGAGAIEWNGELWIVGGSNCGSQTSCYIHRTLHSSDGVTWQDGPETPGDLYVHNQSLYVLNGKLFIGNTKIHSLANAESSWKPVGSLFGSSMVTFLGKAWMINGRSVLSSDDGAGGGLQSKSILPAWLTTDQYVANPGMLVVHGKYLLAIGNAPSAAATISHPDCFKTVLSSLDGIHWGKSSISPCWLPLRYHTILSFKNRLWMFGTVFDSGKVYSADVPGAF